MRLLCLHFSACVCVLCVVCCVCVVCACVCVCCMRACVCLCVLYARVCVFVWVGGWVCLVCVCVCVSVSVLFRSSSSSSSSSETLRLSDILVSSGLVSFWSGYSLGVTTKGWGISRLPH